MSKKKIIIIIFIIFFTAAVLFLILTNKKNKSKSNNTSSVKSSHKIIKELQDESNEQATNETFTCPMHPEVVRDRPGKCPKCGMELVLKEE
ncbi:hypothetical protein KA977_15765 [Candidatus Dependentiae bacterium]|nr:hypothetical protein [Candidatus Dependentiae bacterium]